MQAFPRAVAVTGAAGYVGRRLLKWLLQEDAVERVVAIDVRPAPLVHQKLTYLQQSINAPLQAAFTTAGIEAVIHLAFVLRQLRRRELSLQTNIEGLRNVLGACRSAGAHQMILLSSSTVYGPHPDNPLELTEEAPLRPPQGFHYAVDKVACEALCRRYAAEMPGVSVAVLRACVVMGPNAQNFITTALDRPLLIGLRKADPPWQLLHEDDLSAVLWECLKRGTGGIYNVAAPGTIRWSEVAALAGVPLVRLPALVAYGLIEAAWRLRVQNDAPSAGLDLIRWPWIVSTAKLKQELGYEFTYTSREALESYLAERAAKGHTPSRVR